MGILSKILRLEIKEAGSFLNFNIIS